MELATQLTMFGLEVDLGWMFGLEVDLGWIPRGQNSEADSLTNSEFEGFDPNKRTLLDFEDLKLIVMNKLVEKAAILDEEV